MSSKYIKATPHVVNRWRQRIGTEKTKEEIESIFHRNNYVRLEYGHTGKLIVECGGYVWVIARTRRSITIHTVYCTYDKYKEKCPDKEKAQQSYEVFKWMKQQRKSRR